MKPIPKGYRFPNGPWIKVKVMSEDDMAVAAGSETGGFWDHGNMTIWIDKSMPIKKQWHALWHELLFHAAIDLYDEAFMEERIKPWEE